MTFLSAMICVLSKNKFNSLSTVKQPTRPGSEFSWTVIVPENLDYGQYTGTLCQCSIIDLSLRPSVFWKGNRKSLSSVPSIRNKRNTGRECQCSGSDTGKRV